MGVLVLASVAWTAQETVSAPTWAYFSTLSRAWELGAGALLAVAHRVLNDRGAAEDVLQEVFVGVWRKASQLPELRSHPLAWLTASTRNRAIDVLRQRRPDIPLSWHDDEGQEHSFDAPDEATPSPPETSWPRDVLAPRRARSRAQPACPVLARGVVSPRPALLETVAAAYS